mgnify:CR=1 FL=1
MGGRGLQHRVCRSQDRRASQPVRAMLPSRCRLRRGRRTPCARFRGQRFVVSETTTGWRCASQGPRPQILVVRRNGIPAIGSTRVEAPTRFRFVPRACVPTRVGALHVHLTVVPDRHLHAVRRHPLTVNGTSRDAGKRRIHTERVGPHDQHVGPVSGTTDANFGAHGARAARSPEPGVRSRRPVRRSTAVSVHYLHKCGYLSFRLTVLHLSLPRGRRRRGEHGPAPRTMKRGAPP